MCDRRGGRAGEEGVTRPRAPPRGFRGGGLKARLLLRVGACADELRLMGVGRDLTLVGLSSVGGGYISAT
jgi:hypothetical protein